MKIPHCPFCEEFAGLSEKPRRPEMIEKDGYYICPKCDYIIKKEGLHLSKSMV